MMSCIWSNLLSFTIGAATGSVVTYVVLKKKYEQLVQEEIADVKARFSEKLKEKKTNDEADNEQMSIEFEESSESNDEVDPEDQTAYENYANMYKAPPTGMTEKQKEVMKAMNSRPYVIPPEEFGEKDEYDTLSLTYYADGVLTDEWDEVIEDIDEVVGEDSLTHFGEYEDDSVFVRNDALLTDYEILLDLRKFSDVPRRHKPESGGD
jgi:hypothetical protein